MTEFRHFQDMDGSPSWAATSELFCGLAVSNLVAATNGSLRVRWSDV